MYKKAQQILFIMLCASVVTMLALSALGPAKAAPPAAPTPVANLVVSQKYIDLAMLETLVFSADRNTNGSNVASYTWADLQSTIDQTEVAGVVNTTTLTVQFSNDKINWVDGPTLATNNVADASDIDRIALFGRYFRVKIDVTNTTDLTVTLLALLK